ncbi:hypothetical protein QEN19_000751 [Hanseniaspora menglaensis]
MTDKIEEIVENTTVEKALLDATKDRKASDEIEVDLSASVPLSKKQKRLLRRGKITLDEVNKKFNIDPESIKEYEKELQEKKTVENEKQRAADAAFTEEAEEAKPAKQKMESVKHSVWIGNLSFDTIREDIQRYIMAKVDIIQEKDIVRVNMPLAKNDGKQIKNKGFLYMDFSTEEQKNKVIELSEGELNGRKLLIKDAKNYNGRPDKNDPIANSKNPPSKILFVGNLSFDTTDEQLQKHFQHCGEIRRIRMATFEDTGKCKGFAFLDFADEESCVKAMKDKTTYKMAQRPLRMEFGEDRSKRNVKKKPQQSGGHNLERDISNTPHINNTNKRERREHSSDSQPPVKKVKRDNYNNDKNGRVKSSIALASAQRASAAIVQSTGKKKTFE